MSRNSVITLPRPSLSIPFQRTFPATKENSYNWDHHNGHQGPLKYCQNTQQNILNPFIPSCTNPPMATERAGVCHLAMWVGPAQLNIVICLPLNTHTHTHTEKVVFFVAHLMTSSTVILSRSQRKPTMPQSSRRGLGRHTTGLAYRKALRAVWIHLQSRLPCLPKIKKEVVNGK